MDRDDFIKRATIEIKALHDDWSGMFEALLIGTSIMSLETHAPDATLTLHGDDAVSLRYWSIEGHKGGVTGPTVLGVLDHYYDDHDPFDR